MEVGVRGLELKQHTAGEKSVPFGQGCLGPGAHRTGKDFPARLAGPLGS